MFVFFQEKEDKKLKFLSSNSAFEIRMREKKRDEIEKQKF